VITVLYLPIGSQPGTADAFKQAGVQLHVFDFLAAGDRANAEFLRLVEKYQPDLVHMQLQMTRAITPDTITQARRICPKAIFTNWSGDIRKQACNYFVSISKVVDYSLLSSVGQIALYNNAGAKNPMYWQIGYDPKLYFPKRQSEFKYDVSFIANAHASNLFPDAALRRKIVQRLHKEFGIRAGLFGSGHGHGIGSVDIRKVNDIYCDSICVLSVSNFNNVPHYFSDRLLMCIASGRPTIAYRFPGLDSYFAENGDILVARSEDDIVSLVNKCKNNLTFANAVGHNGWLKANAEHTFKSRILELLSLTNLAGKL